MNDRETLGRIAREAWVKWARCQPNPKPSWLVPWEELAESDKEADRQIGEAIFNHVMGYVQRFYEDPIEVKIE